MSAFAAIETEPSSTGVRAPNDSDEKYAARVHVAPARRTSAICDGNYMSQT